MNLMSNVRFIVISFLLTLMFIGGGIGLTYILKYDDVLGRGIEISGVSLEHLNFDEAKITLQGTLSLPDNITLVWYDNEYGISINDDIASFEFDRALNNALGSHDIINEISWFPHVIPSELPISIKDDIYLKRKVETLKEGFDRSPEDAAMFFKNGKPHIKNSIMGLRMNLSKSLYTIKEYLNKGIYQSIPLQAEILVPQTKTEDLPNVSFCLSTYKSPLNLQDINQVHNIKLALERFNGVIIEPGEVFSFNEVLGSVTADKGYKEAPVIQGRQIVYGIGGGISQLSTAIYQVCLRAGLEIYERHNHSRPVDYVPLGQDANVNFNTQDLKFINTFDYSVVLTGKLDNSIHIYLFGKKDKYDGYAVDIISEIEEILEPIHYEQKAPNLPQGTTETLQEAENGYKVNVYRVIIENENEMSRELISTNTYLPVSEIKSIGAR